MAKSKPFNLGAAYAAKLSANGAAVVFELGDAEFSMPSAASWDEQRLKATAKQSPFDIIREALGDEEYARLEEAAKSTSAGKFDFGMAQELLRHYMEASGLGTQGES